MGLFAKIHGEQENIERSSTSATIGTPVGVLGRPICLSSTFGVTSDCHFIRKNLLRNVIITQAKNWLLGGSALICSKRPEGWQA